MNVSAMDNNISPLVEENAEKKVLFEKLKREKEQAQKKRGSKLIHNQKIISNGLNKYIESSMAGSEADNLSNPVSVSKTETKQNIRKMMTIVSIKNVKSGNKKKPPKAPKMSSYEE